MCVSNKWLSPVASRVTLLHKWTKPRKYCLFRVGFDVYFNILMGYKVGPSVHACRKLFLMQWSNKSFFEFLRVGPLVHNTIQLYQINRLIINTAQLHCCDHHHWYHSSSFINIIIIIIIVVVVVVVVVVVIIIIIIIIIIVIIVIIVIVTIV